MDTAAPLGLANRCPRADLLPDGGLDGQWRMLGWSCCCCCCCCARCACGGWKGGVRRGVDVARVSHARRGFRVRDSAVIVPDYISQRPASQGRVCGTRTNPRRDTGRDHHIPWLVLHGTPVFGGQALEGLVDGLSRSHICRLAPSQPRETHSSPNLETVL